MAEAEKVEAGVKAAVVEEESLQGMSVLDFDMLCTTVALQTRGQSFASKIGEPGEEDELVGEFSAGVQRMWEGEIFDCFEDQNIALQTMCCPCYRFGKNMDRAGLGSSFLQGTVYLALAVTAVLNYLSFVITERHSFLYLALAFTIILGIYMGLSRTQIRKRLNIRANDSSFDDCVHHLVCPCCALCQESRTLEINNVQDGFWSGRSDTICIGSNGEGHPSHSVPSTISPNVPCMERSVSITNHSWIVDLKESETSFLSPKGQTGKS